MCGRARCGRAHVLGGAVERHEEQAEHVGGGQECREERDAVEQQVEGRPLGGVRLPEDLVLAEKPREQWGAGDRERPDQECPVGDRQVLLQPAHVSHVLLAVQRVDHRARAEEQQRLEERVRVEMEDACRVGADAHRQEHVSQLRYGGIREHALDVVLHQADRAGHQRGCRPDRRHDR